MHTIPVSTRERQDIIDITARLQNFISKNQWSSGILAIYSPHTTAGITVNENADPDVKQDMTVFLNHLVPQKFPFAHAEENSDAHIKGSLINFSQIFLVEDGKIQLGTWQGIYFMEFDGPRIREVWVKFIGQ